MWKKMTACLIVLIIAGKSFGQKDEHYFQLASAQFERKDYQKTVEYLNEAISLDQDEGRYYFLRGMAFLKLKELFRAKADFTQCIKFDGNGMAYYQRGTIFMSLQEYGKAVDDFEAAKDVSEDFYEIPYFLGYAYFKLQEYDACIEHFDRYQRNGKVNYRTYYYKGLAESKLNRHEEAMKSLKKAAKLKGNQLSGSKKS